MPGHPGDIDRRDALRTLAASMLAGVGATTLAPVAGCGRASAPPSPPVPATPAGGATAHATTGAAGASPSLPKGEPLRVPLREVPLGQRTTVVYGDVPVELQRTESGVDARLLLCTHFGCPIVWKAEPQRYECPCHGGAFDPSGEPIAGPPTRSLLRVPARIGGDAVIVGGAEG